jgi:hypothetical protein
MISLKTLIVEGRYDALVTKLSKQLLDVIKKSFAATQNERGEFSGVKIHFKEDESRPRIDSDDFKEVFFEEIENETIPVEFYLTLKVQWIDGLNDLRKGGDAYNDDTDYDSSDDATPPLIEIRFEIDPVEYPQVLSEIAMDLRDTLRHEIEHVTQSGWNLKSGKYLPSDMSIRHKIETGELPAVEYFLLPKEIDANLQGLYLQAKKSRKPFAEIVNSYLDNFVYGKVISQQEKETILRAWRNRMPALSIRQEL